MYVRDAIVAVLVFNGFVSGGAIAPNQAEEIVRRSLANMNADWAEAPHYDYTERDVTSHGGTRKIKTYRVLMIEGSTYNQLVAINDHPISADQARQEQRKVQDEIRRRYNETADTRKKRVAQYQKERRQDHALMTEMVNAFQFTLKGEATVDGRRCFALQANPKPGYRPPTRETEVLTGMRGEMWVDAEQYQWVKVHAEVVRPVNFGLFFARVKPGTEFTLEQKPLDGKIWLPSHFAMKVNARLLVFSKDSADDETYSSYYRSETAQ